LAKKAKMGRPTRASRTMSDPVKVETPNRVQLPMWLDLAKQVVAVQETLQEMSHDLSLVVNTQSTIVRGQEETDRRIKRLCQAWGVDVD
jgi:TolA-binding protein